MTPTPRIIDRRLGTLIVLACLAGMAGGGDYQVYLGPTISDDATCPYGDGFGTSSLSFVDGSGAAHGTLPVTGAQILYRLVVIHGQLPNPGDGRLTVRIWPDGVGTFRCQDPAAAGRTRIVGFGSQSTGIGSPPAPWTIDTLSGGACSISLTHLPGGDGPSLEGRFTASGGGSSSFSGSFVVDHVCP